MTPINDPSIMSLFNESERVTLVRKLEWNERRVRLLEKCINMFREPERTILIDILANGQLLPDPDGARYGNHGKHV